MFCTQACLFHGYNPLMYSSVGAIASDAGLAPPQLCSLDHAAGCPQAVNAARRELARPPVPRPRAFGHTKVLPG